MSNEITVHVVKYPGRTNLMMRYRDPITGKQVARTTGSTKQREAERVAVKWEAELRDGRYQKPSRMIWQEFRQRYTDEKLSTLAENTLSSADSALNHIERVINPRMLESLNAEQLSRFQRLLTSEGMKATTLATHLRAIRVALNWAQRQGFIRKTPDIDMPKAAKGINRGMRGRPITGEEFDRMIQAVPKIRKLEPEKWERLLRGLWLSGLRLGEALKLSWDADAEIAVQVDGKYPRLRLLAEGHKALRDQLLPITPDFAEFLLQTPKDERHGLVFGIYGGIPGEPLSTKRAGRYISAIGEKALVVTDPTVSHRRVNKETGEVTFVPGYASAHDLRRSFGTRWANKVMPRVLMQLMRHMSISTTMKFYIESNADSVQAELWNLTGNTLGNSGENPTSESSDPHEVESRNALSYRD